MGGNGRLGVGETVLIQGIGGGVSLMAMQVALAKGATVIVTSSSDEKLERAIAMGAVAGINYRTQDVAREVKALTGGRGADVVVDNGGKASLPASLAAVGKRGRIVTSGAISGGEAQLSIWQLVHKQVTLIGSSSLDADLAAAVAFVGEHEIRPVVTTHPWLHIDEAFGALGRGEQFGKLVLEID